MSRPAGVGPAHRWIELPAGRGAASRRCAACGFRQEAAELLPRGGTIGHAPRIDKRSAAILRVWFPPQPPRCPPPADPGGGLTAPQRKGRGSTRARPDVHGSES